MMMMMMMMTTAIYTALIVYNFHCMTNFHNCEIIFFFLVIRWKFLKTHETILSVTNLSIKRQCEKFLDVYILIASRPPRFDRCNI